MVTMAFSTLLGPKREPKSKNNVPFKLLKTSCFESYEKSNTTQFFYTFVFFFIEI